MTPEQLGNVAVSLKAALAIIEAAECDATPTVTEVGGDGDPIRVRFERKGCDVKVNVLHTDESLRGKRELFKNTDGFSLCSSRHPAICMESLFVRGIDREKDLHQDRTCSRSPLDAAVLIARAYNAVLAFNAQWRAENAKPTLEQDIERVRRAVSVLSDGSHTAFERIVAKVK